MDHLQLCITFLYKGMLCGVFYMCIVHIYDGKQSRKNTFYVLI